MNLIEFIKLDTKLLNWFNMIITIQAIIVAIILNCVSTVPNMAEELFVPNISGSPSADARKLTT